MSLAGALHQHSSISFVVGHVSVRTVKTIEMGAGA